MIVGLWTFFERGFFNGVGGDWPSVCPKRATSAHQAARATDEVERRIDFGKRTRQEPSLFFVVLVSLITSLRIWSEHRYPRLSY
jgi:hypothetical protein